jgi:hypothetical protein
MDQKERLTPSAIESSDSNLPTRGSGCYWLLGGSRWRRCRGPGAGVRFETRKRIFIGFLPALRRSDSKTHGPVPPVNAPDAMFVKAHWQRTDFAHKNGTGPFWPVSVAHHGAHRFSLGYIGPYLEQGPVLIKGSGLGYRAASLALLIPRKRRVLLL